jgi:hypothetical protein
MNKPITVVKRTTRAKMKRPEQDLQRQLCKMLQTVLLPGTFWYAVPNGGYRTPAEAAILQGQGVRAGVPDLAFVHAGKALFLELKAQDGYLTPIQRAVHDELRKAGARVEVARSLNQAFAHLQSFGVPMREIHWEKAA